MPTVRVLETPAELRAAFEVFRTALVGIPPLPGEMTTMSEPGRTFGGYLDDTLVGTASAYSTRLVVPGGARVPHLAVTRVGVLPTHTRRGVARAMMNAQLRDARERGVPVATLRAAEGGIYERYGYGVAGWNQVVEVSARLAVFRRDVPVAGPLRLVAPDDAWPAQQRVYERVDPGWVGAISRTDEWWTVRRLRNEEEKALVVVVVCGPPGAETGYARYHPVELPDDSTAIVVHDLVAADEATRGALLRYLLSIDLVDIVRFPALALDDPLRLLLVDERAVRTTAVEDEIWLRLVDVPAALAAREYRGRGEVVVGITDTVIPENAGNYWIGATGAKPTTAPAQLVVDVATLGAVYLGGTYWRQLTAAGRVGVHDPAALAVADELFATDAAPFCGTFF